MRSYLRRATLVAAILAGTANAETNLVHAPQGGVARWEGIPAKECGIYGKRYPAVDKVCYYPVDIQARAGDHQIALIDEQGKQHLGHLVVEDHAFPDVSIDLPPELNRFINPSAEESARAAKESAEVAKVLRGAEQPPHFSLPLGKPAGALPSSANDFGSLRTFNGKVHSRHSGLDFPVSEGQRVNAMADGTVTLAADHFFTGNAVYIDHGDGLVSMYFHLKALNVHTGDTVKRGQSIGSVGGTGRATGPHLHIGLRWLGKRIDPERLLEAPSKLPSVGDTKAEAQRKIDESAAKEPPETDAPMDDEG